MHIRKSFIDLTVSERDAFLAALLELKQKPAVESDAAKPPVFSVYDQFIAIHTAAVSVTSAINGGDSHNLGHNHPGFLPWHREFLLRIQRALTAVDSSVVIPYWDWTARRATMDYLFTDDFMGSIPVTTPSTPEPVKTGYFTKVAPANPPSWWPNGFQGWTIPDELWLPWEPWDGELHRRVGSEIELPTEEHIDVLMRMSTYRAFWAGIEQGIGIILGPGPLFGPTHNWMHGWVGGHMGQPMISPFDPVFSLNHAFVDYLWDSWQRRGHDGIAFYPQTDDWDGNGLPGEIPRGHLLHDSMYPWVGSKSSDYIADEERVRHFLPEVSAEDPRRPIDVLDTANLSFDPAFNYMYQPPLPRFAKVKQILDRQTKEWETDRGRPPELTNRHQNELFGWADRDQLLEAEARRLPLIQPDMIGNDRAEETNLVRILRGRLRQFPRMPHNGPYMNDIDINFIASWIDNGCLDDAEPPSTETVIHFA